MSEHNEGGEKQYKLVTMQATGCPTDVPIQSAQVYCLAVMTP